MIPLSFVIPESGSEVKTTGKRHREGDRDRHRKKKTGMF